MSTETFETFWEEKTVWKSYGYILNRKNPIIILPYKQPYYFWKVLIEPEPGVETELLYRKHFPDEIEVLNRLNGERESDNIFRTVSSCRHEFEIKHWINFPFEIRALNGRYPLISDTKILVFITE